MTATSPVPSPIPSTKQILQESTGFFKGHWQPLLLIACLGTWLSSRIKAFPIGFIFIESLFLAAVLCLLIAKDDCDNYLKKSTFLGMLILYFPILGIVMLTPTSVGLVVVELFRFIGISHDTLMTLLSNSSNVLASFIVLMATISALIAGIYATFRVAMAPALFILRREGVINALRASWSCSPLCSRQLVEGHLFITALNVASTALIMNLAGNSTVTLGVVHVLMRLGSSFLVIFLFHLANHVNSKENRLQPV